MMLPAELRRYLMEDGKHLAIDMEFDQGRKYYFRDITWTGNSVYASDVLNSILQVKKGDVYDLVTLQKRLHGGGKENEYDVSKLYKDNGYLFFNVTPVEVNIQNDSVDLELRISEGKPAVLNEIVINGNDLTNERVIRRQLMTRPGYLFSQTDFERSIREIASMGQFDSEAIMQYGTGYNIIPNQLNNTVDIIYNVTEKPSSQLELSGGWGGNTFVLTAGVSFNNFSTRRMFEKGAWRPVPLGDAQIFNQSAVLFTADTEEQLDAASAEIDRIASEIASVPGATRVDNRFLPDDLPATLASFQEWIPQFQPFSGLDAAEIVSNVKRKILLGVMRY